MIEIPNQITEYHTIQQGHHKMTSYELRHITSPCRTVLFDITGIFPLDHRI